MKKYYKQHVMFTLSYVSVTIKYYNLVWMIAGLPTNIYCHTD